MSTSVRTSGLAGNRQRGVALIIGLLMLLVITVLGVVGMSMSTTELSMASGERLRSGAFRAAEAGIERAISNLATVPQDLAAPTVVANVPMPSAPTDAFTTSSQYRGDGDTVPGMSVGKFVGLHYDVTSVGTSVANARSQQVQGAYVLTSSAGGSYAPLP
jgi:Tfp pilus assembly protein PilX